MTGNDQTIGRRAIRQTGLQVYQSLHGLCRLQEIGKSPTGLARLSLEIDEVIAKDVNVAQAGVLGPIVNVGVRTAKGQETEAVLLGDDGLIGFVGVEFDRIKVGMEKASVGVVAGPQGGVVVGPGTQVGSDQTRCEDGFG
mmetsp:Transcript_32049/g.49676  ORF Transcript_32049/g.49676 Transcript_32049/m.49676 type:complete len:140 (+) Transcript_32049:1064-1483(+)